MAARAVARRMAGDVVVVEQPLIRARHILDSRVSNVLSSLYAARLTGPNAVCVNPAGDGYGVFGAAALLARRSRPALGFLSSDHIRVGLVIARIARHLASGHVPGGLTAARSPPLPLGGA